MEWIILFISEWAFVKSRIISDENAAKSTNDFFQSESETIFTVESGLLVMVKKA